MSSGDEAAVAEAAAERQRQYANDLTIDETKLTAAATSEQGDIFLIQWLAKAEVALTKLELETLKIMAADVEKTLLRFVYPAGAVNGEGAPTGKTPVNQMPKPGRPARHLIARCIVTLFRRADSKGLFDVGQTLLKIASDETKGARAPEKESKVAALYVLGELFAVQGQNVMSIFLEIVATTQKIFKNTSVPVIQRYHALMCLQKTLSTGGRSLDDLPAKELLKSLRQSLSDRAGAVTRGASECILAMADNTSYLVSRSEIEAVLAIVFKSLDGVDFVTKRSLARLTAGLLATTQMENSAPPPPPSAKKTGKKKKDGAGDDSDEEEGVGPQSASAATGEARTMLSPNEVLEQLSQPFYRSSSSRKTKYAILDFYTTLLTTLGPTWVRNNYGVILKHLINDLANHPRSTSTRAETLSIRTGIQLILRRVVGERMLGEQSQVGAVQEICEAYLKRYPTVMPGAPPPPSKYTLVLALSEISGLVHQLGTAPPQVLDALYQPLLRCLGHPSHSVQIHAAWCLRTLCTTNPNQLTSTILTMIDLLNKDLATLTGAGERSGHEVPRRTNGHARGLAALISVIPSRPLHTSFDISVQVLNIAVQLLKTCGSHSLPISGVEIQVAWTLLSSLMSLGPNFVRLHLSQLLLLWRNALPKPTSKDTTPGASGRSDAEWAFLLHVRENTLGCVLAFLTHNSQGLLTLDTARRIVALLSNALAFVDGFSASHPGLVQEQVPGAERSSLTLLDREHMLRRRVFQCFCLLSSNPAMEPLQDSMVHVALQTFAEPERYVGSAAQAAIAASAGTFTTLWAVPDGYAFGVTSLQRDDETFIAEPNQSRHGSFPATRVTTRPDLLNRDPIEAQIDALQRRPILGAIEHDPLVLWARHDISTAMPPISPQPATAMIDAALSLFAALLPFQNRDVQINAFETMLSYCRSNKIERNPGRRAAVQVNSCVATLGALRTTMQGGTGISGKRPTGFNNDRMTTALREVLKDALLQGDSVLRAVSSQTYGRLAAVAGSQAMSSQVQFLVDQVVSNRDPDARAGCARAFGAIYSEVGGLSAGPLTKTVVNVLMSLSNDPHPTVHYSALEALRLVIDAASLSYSQYVSGTLGMLVKLYMMDTHEPEGGSAGSVNLRADLPAEQAICRVISGLIGVLGPDLQDSTKVRGLLYVLLDEFSKEKDDGVVVEATKAKQHFCLFAAEQIDMQAWILQLTDDLKSRQRPRKLAAVNGFYQLVQRQALLLSKIAGDSLVADLFALLDLEPDMDGVREVLLSWLRQTADLSPGSWIDLCQRIMSKVAKGPATNKAEAQAPAPGQLQDEEAAAIDLGEDVNSALQGSRWRTQLFALQCLHEVFLVVQRSGRGEHFQAPPQGLNPQQTRALMSSRVVDLIRMAFTASTAANAEIRLEGLVLLQDVIQSFSAARDPDFQEALMLEQHQAPIAAALTPAFSADSTPEVLAAAVQVCAVFVGSGVVREVDRMGRILKQLVSALESCMNPDMDSLGQVKNLSPNATAMLKVAVFTAWGDLEVSTVTQDYLVPVLKPHLASLGPYWLSSLREYAKLKTDPDSSSAGLGFGIGGVVVNPSLDSQFAGLAREVLMPHYERSWYKMLQAVAVMISQNHPAILKAMDGESTGTEAPAKAPSAFRTEPTVFFFVLYGLAFEALATDAGGSTSGTSEAARQTQILSIALTALKYLAQPQFAGTALLQDATFEELCNLCYRVILTESFAVQAGVVELVASLAANYGQRLLDDGRVETGTTAVSGPPPKAKLTQLLRVVVFVLSETRQRGGPVDDKVALLRVAFTAYISIAEMFVATVQEDLYAIALFLYSQILRDETFDVDIVGPTLGCLRDLCDKSGKIARPNSDTIPRTIHGFLSSALNSIDELRGRAGRIPVNKTKNCLIATTVILTSLPVKIKISQAVLEHACYLITSKLDYSDDVDGTAAEIAFTAVNCGRSLLIASGRGSPALQYCVGQILPGFIEFVANVGPQLSDSPRDLKSPRFLIASEIFKAFEGLCGVFADTHRTKLLTVLLPTLIVHLSPSTALPTALHTLAVTTLLSIASHHAAAFREATSMLDSESKTVLEVSIRNAVEAARKGSATEQGAGVRGVGAGGAEARIALRSFGST